LLKGDQVNWKKGIDQAHTRGHSEALLTVEEPSSQTQEATVSSHKSLKRWMADIDRMHAFITGSQNQTRKDTTTFKTGKQVGPTQLHFHVHPFIYFCSPELTRFGHVLLSPPSVTISMLFNFSALLASRDNKIPFILSLHIHFSPIKLITIFSYM
jgi:hypothetical protein